MNKNDSPKTYKRLGQVARTKVLVKRKEVIEYAEE